MLCETCGRDSSNRRVCPHCFTPYPGVEQEGRPSAGTRGRTPTPGSLPAVGARRTPTPGAQPAVGRVPTPGAQPAVGRVPTPGAQPAVGARRTPATDVPAAVPPDTLWDRLARAYAQAHAFAMQQTPIVRWSSAGIIVVLVFWMFSGSNGPRYAAGSVPSLIIATPMQREEALALIKRTRETALVEMQADEVSVSYPAATFPLRSDGQIALAQQFARADEIVEGKKRRIFFYNPGGHLFAQSDGVTGVTVVR